jgi:hypothetical protein
MNIGFDLDGVIVSQDIAILRLLDRLNLNRKVRDEIAYFYYTSRTLQLNPLDFIAENDTLYIITGRSKKYESITRWFVTKYFPTCKLIILNHIEPTNIEKNKLHSWFETQAKLKAHIINKYNINVYFEDSPEVVKYLRVMCPNCNIIQVSWRKIKNE